MVDFVRESRWWDKSLESDLPDCRVRSEYRERKLQVRGRMQMETVYCANCFKESGLVTANWTPHVFFICDPCVGRIGKPPGVTEIDPSEDSPPKH